MDVPFETIKLVNERLKDVGIGTVFMCTEPEALGNFLEEEMVLCVHNLPDGKQDIYVLDAEFPADQYLKGLRLCKPE